MESESLASGSPSACNEASSTFDEVSLQQSLIFSDSLKDLKNLRSQLYSAAEYFEISYNNDDHKQIVVDTLKDYAVKAIVNTVDHLGSISYKVNGIIDERVDEVSKADTRVSFIEQRLRTCQEVIDYAGRSEQSVYITTPKYHKRYILPDGGSLPASGTLAVPQSPDSPIHSDAESQLFRDDVRSTIRSRSRAPSFRKGRSPSPFQRARSSSPSRLRTRTRSPSPAPRPPKNEIPGPGLPVRRPGVPYVRSSSPVPTSSASLLRSGSMFSRPALFHSNSVAQRLLPDARKSTSAWQQAAEKHVQKDSEQEAAGGKGKKFLKSLFSRRKIKKDELLYTYLDEY